MAQKKKEYQKPILERLALIPRENVLAACADLTGSGDWTYPICDDPEDGCFAATLRGLSFP
jgi:hypothetical protein